MTKYNFEGWDFTVWLARNKDSLKLIVSGAAGLAAAWATGLSPVWSAAAGTLVAAVSKILIDSLDYWQSE